FSERAVISRVGGDEFIVFIPDTIEMTELMKKMSMALEIMKFEIASEKRRSQVSASMGATLITSNNVNYEMLYKQADIAIYQAKRNGKCGYAIYQTMK
ncbi:MAG: diguanylate cyclase, partial [Clostridiales bacterium]|nr:diguanylate cyclase [Clostridiales bacterium]